MAERARTVITTGRALPVTYDMRDDADDIFGLGVGCNGLIRVLLQALVPGNAHEPFATLSALMQERAHAATATIVESADRAADVGATIVCSSDGELHALGNVVMTPARLRGCNDALASGRARLETEPSGVRVLYAPLPRVPRFLILGAGLDAVPLVNMAAELGWRTMVCDHRPAYLERHDLTRADELKLVVPSALATQIDLDAFDAVLVMSHHLATDEMYLRALASVPTHYVGVLGPRDRKTKLLAALGDSAEDLGQRLRGPVGLDIGASSPEAIALSVLAELQAVFADRLTAIAKPS